MTAQRPARPSLFAVCEQCGRSAGLPVPGFADSALCPACTSREALRGAARVQLEDLTAPVVGAWASAWSAAGLHLEELEAVTEAASGAWALPEYGHRMRCVFLRRLMRAYPLPPVDAVEVPPVRVGVDFAALPLLTAFYPEDPRPGADLAPVFGAGAGRIVQPFPGVDTLALTLPDGVRAVLYTGQGGQVPYQSAVPTDPAGYRVPPELWPAFEVYMSGREAWADLPAYPIRAKRPAPEGASA